MDTIGLIQLRIAYGMYPLSTPRKERMVAPQVFQGKKLDVMVPESSRHLDRFFGASLISSNASLNILPGNTRDRYWSQQIAFTKMQQNSVARTRPPLPLATFSRMFAKEAMMPVQSTMPPKHIAQRMMEMVQNMLCIPPPSSRLASSTMTLEASSGTLPMEIPLFRMLKTLFTRVSSSAAST